MFHGIRLWLHSPVNLLIKSMESEAWNHPDSYHAQTVQSLWFISFVLYHFYFLANVFKCVDIVMNFLFYMDWGSST